MTLIAGVDPGTNGAVAVYDTDSKRILCMYDMPSWMMTVGKKQRKRVDAVGLMELVDTLCVLGVTLVVIEAVGGRPRQSASGGFVFGYTVGMFYMACIYNKLMIETVPPLRWKKMLNVPGKKGGKQREEKKQAVADIMNRANELFPDDRHLFRTDRGAYRMDRADAAMLAKFGGDFVLPTMPPVIGDVELKLAYSKAETGG